MLIWIIAGLVVLTFISAFLLKNNVMRAVFSGIFGMLTVAGIVLLSMNMNSHFGMEERTTVSTQEVYSITPAQAPMKAVATKKIGADNQVLVYKDSENAAEATPHFAPDKKNMVKTTKTKSSVEKANVENAQVKTTTKSWTYESDLMEFLFDHDSDQELISVQHVLQVPAAWQIIEK
ncbi:DUF4811 domain-containing protein [Fructobacillus sp. W13]|uniref:DUF4811 domain-containing protein n=1 Tax=Fructobacillus apis TaxID=2935017 RepID=A0ABT0ZPW4_9LACO|nr:DUF4811 domain-containing protein [Fructobacillus apis]MCO0832007.1 DUF4811 domain-containing protein [Fructobacillus apis]